MSQLAISALFEYLCDGSTASMNISIFRILRLQIMTYEDF